MINARFVWCDYCVYRETNKRVHVLYICTKKVKKNPFHYRSTVNRNEYHEFFFSREKKQITKNVTASVFFKYSFP